MNDTSAFRKQTTRIYVKVFINIIINLFKNMKNIFDEDVEVLEIEILNCYICNFCDQKFLQPQRQFSVDQISLIKIDMAVGRVLGGKSFEFNKIFDLLNDIVQLRQHLNSLEDNKKNKKRAEGYKVILYAYLELDFYCHAFEHEKLQRRINGIRNVKRRYEGNLYEKREIIYRVLLETVKKEGRWQTVTAAINAVYPRLEKEFKAFDQQWITRRIEQNNARIEKLMHALENNKIRCYHDTDIRIQDRTYENEIKILEKENIEFEKALNTHHVADVLGKQLAFNSNDQVQTIINHVRNCPELLAEILVKNVN